jgi:hypothetical protein
VGPVTLIWRLKIHNKNVVGKFEKRNNFGGLSVVLLVLFGVIILSRVLIK